MSQIKFCHNWNNKLNGTVFTTIRKNTYSKADYYIRETGKIFDVVLNDKQICKAKLIHVTLCIYDELAFEIIAADTGISDKTMQDNLFCKFGINKTDAVIVLLFERVIV